MAEWGSGLTPRRDPATISTHVKQMVDSIMKNYDLNQDGYISLEDFERIAANFPLSSCTYESDREGEISCVEITSYFVREMSACAKLDRNLSNMHNFHDTTYKRPILCDMCRGILWGVMKPGYHCKDCGVNCHSHCKDIVMMQCTKTVSDCGSSHPCTTAPDLKKASSWSSAEDTLISPQVNKANRVRSHSTPKNHTQDPTSHDHSIQTQGVDRNGGQPNILRSPTQKPPARVTPEMLLECSEMSYRLRCPHAGLFHCSLTGIVFLMEGEGEVLYRTVQWDEGLLASTGRHPAGPLFNIACPQGSVCQLHLPHCEILSGVKRMSLSVAHVSGDSMELLCPVRVTDSHVVVDVTDLSGWGLLSSLREYFRTFKSQVLLFLQQTDPKYSILNVIILPSNVPFSEVKEKQKGTTDLQMGSYCRLTIGERYILNCHLVEAPRIKPTDVVMDMDYGPNYHPTFRVFLLRDTEEVELRLLDKTLKKQEGQEVWSELVPLTGKTPGADMAAGPVSNERFEHAQTGCLEEQLLEEQLQALSLDQRGHAKQWLKALSFVQRRCAQNQLQTVRSEFVKRVTLAKLSSLLDELRQCGIISQDEEESVKAVAAKEERARHVIDTVLSKGPEACTIMKVFLLEQDPFLCTTLGLRHSEA